MTVCPFHGSRFDPSHLHIYSLVYLPFEDKGFRNWIFISLMRFLSFLDVHRSAACLDGRRRRFNLFLLLLCCGLSIFLLNINQCHNLANFFSFVRRNSICSTFFKSK